MSSIARQAVLNTVLTYVGIALGFLNVVVLYPRVLASEEFGLTRLLVSVVAIAAQVAQLGAEHTIIRYFPYYRDPLRKHRGSLSIVLLFALTVSLLAMLVLGILHGWLSSVFSDRSALYGNYGLLALPLVAGEIHFILLRSYSRSLRRTVQPTFIREFLMRVGQTGLIAAQALHPMPFGWFMVAYTALFLIGTLLLAFDLWRSGNFKLGWSQRWFPRRMRRSMAAFSGFTFSASLAGVVLGNMDQLMIGALLDDGLRQVAHYAVAFYFGTVIAAPGRALNQAAMPLVAEAWRRRDMPALRRIYVRSSLVQTLVSGWFFLLLCIGIQRVFTLLPEEYAHATRVVLVVGLAYLLNSTMGLAFSILSLSRSYRLDAYSSLAMLLLNVGANYVFIRWLGIIGAAWATLLSLVVVGTFRMLHLRARYGLWPYDRRVFITGILIALLAAAVLGSPRLLGTWPDVVVKVLVVSVLLGSAARSMGVVREFTTLLRGGRGGAGS